MIELSDSDIIIRTFDLVYHNEMENRDVSNLIRGSRPFQYISKAADTISIGNGPGEKRFRECGILTQIAPQVAIIHRVLVDNIRKALDEATWKKLISMN